MNNEMEFEYNDEWAEAKRQVGQLRFPTEIGLFKEDKSVTAHYSGKNRHDVMHYKAVLPSIKGFNLEASYTVCNECPDKIRSQKFYLFNNSENTVYIRELIKEKREY